MKRLQAIGMVAGTLVLSACSNFLPLQYTPVIEPPRVVDTKTPLAQMVRQVQPKPHPVQTSIETSNETSNHGEVMKNKRLNLTESVEKLMTEPDAGASGIYPLVDGVQAFAVRNALIKNAMHTLDLQYYSMHKGLSSRLLIRELVRAADRGVKIRILIDDMDTLGRDKEMTILAAHDNIEVRIFNPIRRLRGTVLSRSLMLVMNLNTQHRRMHNKVWLADGVLGITGGRNIGDRYFNANESDNFSDLDVLLSGATVRQMQTSFDSFWNSTNAIPVEIFQKAPPAETAKDIQKMIFSTNALTRKERVARHPYLSALDEAENHVLPNVLPKLLWGQIDFYSDSPTKINAPPASMSVHVPKKPNESSGSVMFDALLSRLKSAKREVILANPYFLPGDDFMQVLADLVKRGVSVTLLSNSLESNDVSLVNGAYSRYRWKLLQSGVKLYELRGYPVVDKTPQWRHPIFSWKGSRTALHSKAAVIDGEISFVGSMNLDPRSIIWNTEVGVIAQQPIFAKKLRDILLNAMSLHYSYEVKLNEKGQLEWLTEEDEERDEHDQDDTQSPQSSAIMRKLSAPVQKIEVIEREPSNFWRRLQKNIGAWLPETFL